MQRALSTRARASVLASAATKYRAGGLSQQVRFAHKELKFGVEGRAALLAGVDTLARAVATTLGPKGRNVLIESSFGSPKITKDGVTVAKAIEFEDKFENIGAQLVRQVASKTNDIAGDGTTTATILTRAIFAEGVKSVAAGMNPMDLRRGITAGVEFVVAELKKRTHLISTKDEIASVATISANGEVAIGRLIADALEKVGKEGVISVQDGKTMNDELEVVEGMRFERGFVSPYFITNQKTQKADFDDAYVLLYDGKISSIHSIVAPLEHAMKSNKPLIIVCEDVDGEALATLVLNKLRGSMKIAAVKAPGFGDNRKAALQDIAVLTGGQLISEEIGLKLEDVKGEMLGRAKKITISKDDTIILGGSGTVADLEERCNLIRDAIATTTSDYEKEKLQERLARLSGGVAVIRVGGASEVEVGEKKDRIDDALNATRAAIQEGIVPGGGVALLYSSDALKTMRLDNEDQNVGVRIVREALRAPCRAIAANAGYQGDVIIGKLLEKNEGKATNTLGFNAATGEYVDMVAKGIIDPTKVVRTALVDAAGVASLMTTTECMIVEAPKPAGGPSGGAPPPYQGDGSGMF